jgi:hypothetical protein
MYYFSPFQFIFGNGNKNNSTVAGLASKHTTILHTAFSYFLIGSLVKLYELLEVYSVRKAI